jgi:hypothetical protein
LFYKSTEFNMKLVSKYKKTGRFHGLSFSQNLAN